MSLRVSIDTPRAADPVLASTLMTSAVLVPMSIKPLMCEPSLRFSVSAAADSLIAVPPVPVMVPELVMTLPPPPAPIAWMPIAPEMAPALVTLAALLANIALPEDDRMMPELKLFTVASAFASNHEELLEKIESLRLIASRGIEPHLIDGAGI